MQESLSKEGLIEKLEDFKAKVCVFKTFVMNGQNKLVCGQCKVEKLIQNVQKLISKLVTSKLCYLFQAQERQKKLELELAELKNKVCYH